MQGSDAFHVNGPQVISENIEGEVVIIDLARGTYYSTTLVGADVWGLVLAGCSVDEILGTVRDSYEVNGEPAEDKVLEFLRELQNEALIVTTAGSGNGKTGAHRAGLKGRAGDRTAFAAPVLSKYTDMQDMLLLDPIHDVEASGWPSPKDEG